MRWRFWQSKQRDSDLEDEIAFDLAADAEERIRSGIPREEAESASRRDFGNVLRLEEDVREVWGWTALDRLGQDLRYGWRTLRNNPLFAAMAVLSLALGIGANTAIYSFMDAVMLRDLPVRHPGELVILNWHAKKFPPVAYSSNGSTYDEPGGGITSPDFPWPAYELFRNHNTLFSALSAFKDAGQLNLVARGQAEVRSIELVSGNFFNCLGIVPVAGRLIADSDNLAGASQVAVLSYNYWRERFAGDLAALGQSLRINNLAFTIIGIAPPGFFGVRPGSAPVIYVPIANRPSLARNYGTEDDTMFVDPHFYWVDIMGRLRPGVTLARAEAELAPQFHQFALASVTKNEERAVLPALWLEEGGSGGDSLRRQYSKPLFVLMTMVAFILAIACANIANLLLARATARRREMAVRLSLGASRLRVLRQLLTESLMLALPGGIIGLAVAVAGIRFLIWLLTGNNPADLHLHVVLDWRILVFTIAVALVTGILFGLAPAIQAMRVDITPALKETRASTPHKRGRRIGLSQFLVVAQIALSLLLVLGSAIFVRTLANLHSVEIGFNQENLLTFSLDTSQAGYKDMALTTLYARMYERFRALPGVRAAAVTDMPLLFDWNSGTGVRLPGAPKCEGDGCPHTSLISVGPTFFETMQIPISLGRPIDSRDADGAPLAAVVNEVFAKRYFPNRNPIGRRFGLGSSKGDLTIVGVAKNARYSSLKREIPPVVYFAYLQNIVNGPPGATFFILRTAGNPLALSETVRKTVHEAAPAVPVTNMMTQVQRIDSTIVQERTFADLCTAFAVFALMIACIGLYGTMAYTVARRTNEIGIRVALGAERRRIIWMVLREVLALAAAGLAVGLICAWSAMSAIKSFVFGMKVADPPTILLAAGILVAALLLAGFAPAARASRIDPLTALRHE
ncbi:MAG TPA: ABC transporter permease [Bryobacteraceae bacterium]|jgi:predicted permease